MEHPQHTLTSFHSPQLSLESREKRDDGARDLPTHNEEKKRGWHIHPAGESGRRGFHPLKFVLICFRSSCTLSKAVNVLWPVVPFAFALHFAKPDYHLLNFILPYIAMVPSANLLGFAGGELANKLPRVIGVMLETTLGSLVELILLIVLVRRGSKNVPVIKAAILGSILANLLLCLGLCFFAGGIRREEQEFHQAISEVANGLMLVAGMGLVLPAIFSSAKSTTDNVVNKVLKISRGTSVILLAAYLVYVWFQMHSHHSMYNDIFESHKDEVEHKDRKKGRLTASEALVAVVMGIICVTFMAIFLVDGIDFIVEERHIKDAFLGLILVPLVEKAAEHITAVDEAWDGHINFALSHVLGSSVQTALLNTPLIVLIGWGIGVPMDLNFEIFDAAVLILAIIVVGNLMRDGKSNYLEGLLCIFVYLIIAISAFYYPNQEIQRGGIPRGDEGERNSIFQVGPGMSSTTH
ncbi:hypothetical protein BT63DRAFT_70084 [Microthyrium microscopicum]|uniref:Vacuolar calcium ion transporter n=1 Tax=Microthyrium microscopicum TaxID=703497 RepID=A0A6A6U1Z9_9PEZI|nr:hypothetical protein BT63DRAFT_70084 [Microthyrium microscopicum]